MKAGKGVVRKGDSRRTGLSVPEVRALPSRSGLVFLRRMAVVGLALCLADSVLAELTRPDFSRYEVIITRRPFGEPRPDPTPVPVPPEPPPLPPFTLKLTLCGITVDGDETRVGFLDKEKNPPVSYYLQVGEEQGGFKVISADYEGGSVLLEKEGRQETLTMADGPAGAPKLASAVGVPRPDAAVSPRPVAPAVDRGASLADKIKARRLELQQMRGGGQPSATPPAAAPTTAAPTPAGGGRSVTTVTAPAPAPASAPAPLPPPLDPAAAAALEKKTREYNMELIRAKGEKGPPLPIQLTEDEDAQLVNEGVLEPPQ